MKNIFRTTTLVGLLQHARVLTENERGDETRAEGFMSIESDGVC